MNNVKQLLKDGSKYKRCTRCVMDTSNFGIEFDDHGICDSCKSYERLMSTAMPSLADREKQLADKVGQMKKEGAGKDYDCIIGVSGGVDSTYVAYLTKDLGLRPLAVHLDNGWNTELAVSNIEKCLKALDIDLYTHVLHWDSFRDLQLAFLKAATPDSEFPTDHAIVALMNQKALDVGTRFIITGVNLSTEGIIGAPMGASAFDWKYINHIHKTYGSRKLSKSYPKMSLLKHFYCRYIKKFETVYLLNYIDFNKEEAVEHMKAELGWQPYTGKHHESIYTRFFQSFILPIRHGFDKRTMHLSTLIMSGQMSRAAALSELEKEICPADIVKLDKQYVAKKLGLSQKDFDTILNLPPRQNSEFPSYEKTWYLKLFRKYRNAS